MKVLIQGRFGETKLTIFKLFKEEFFVKVKEQRLFVKEKRFKNTVELEQRLFVKEKRSIRYLNSKEA